MVMGCPANAVSFCGYQSKVPLDADNRHREVRMRR
jgi:hypothetical protein